MPDDWGFKKLAHKERANKIVERIIFLEGHPNLQQVGGLRIGQNVKEVLAGKKDAWNAYTKSRQVCAADCDYVTKNLFEQLIADEEGHIDFLETQLDLLKTLGEERCGQLNAESADA